jgi:hypothetical protein
VSKPLQHCHALVAVAFESEDARKKLVAMLAGKASLEAELVESYTHEGQPAAIIHVRYRARGANMNDVPRRLEAAASAANVELRVLHEPVGFSIKRPDLEQSHPAPEPTQPTEPVQADLLNATTVAGVNAPFEGALQVPLVGSLDDEWLRALDYVRAGTDVLEAVVEDDALYVPDPWRGQPVVTGSGDVRQRLREEVVKFLNLVNADWRTRTAPHRETAEDTFEALSAHVLSRPSAARLPIARGTPRPAGVYWPRKRDSDARYHITWRFLPNRGERSWRQQQAGEPAIVPPATDEERDAAVDKLIAEGVRVIRLAVRDDEANRGAVLFRGWVGAEPWLVAHVFERGRSQTWTAPEPHNPDSEEDVAWQEIEDDGRFAALTKALDEEPVPPAWWAERDARAGKDNW